MRSWLRSPFVALFVLILLFELPSLSLPEPLRPTGELLLLLCVWLLSQRLPLRFSRPLRYALASCGVLLVLVRLDRVGFMAFMGEEPLLYDQLFMLRHLLVLFSDLWSWEVAAVLVGIALLSALALFVVRFLLRVSRTALEPRRISNVRAVLGLFFLFLLLGSWLPSGRAHAVRWMTPALLANLAESRRIYASVQRKLSNSPYRGYRALKLSRKPSVYLILIESYGRVLAEHPTFREPLWRKLKHMQRSLGTAGWYAASAFSRAPVMGGRSWLAEGSLLMGTHVGYEAVFHHLIDNIDRVPNLVSFLAAQGYYTLLLAPSDRKRPGVEEVNYYRYRQSIRFDDLDYHGPKLGWGIVPDQYSLEYADAHVLRAAKRPLFFNFHMVSSHAPWEEIPRLVSDFHTLNERRSNEPFDEPIKNASLMRLQRYVHKARRFAYVGELKESIGRDYLTAILYDLSLLERYLGQLREDAIVIVMGDHQPPFLAVETRSFDTPMHVLARDPRLLDELKAHGFKDGLWLDPLEPTALAHEGFFSLFVRTLVDTGRHAPPLPIGQSPLESLPTR